MRAYFSKRPPCAPADPAPVIQCVPYMRQSASERVGAGESSRSRLWLNSLFGESHVPGDVALLLLALSLSATPVFRQVRDFTFQVASPPSFVLLMHHVFFFRFPDLKSLGHDSIARRSILFFFLKCTESSRFSHSAATASNRGVFSDKGQQKPLKKKKIYGISSYTALSPSEHIPPNHYRKSNQSTHPRVKK